MFITDFMGTLNRIINNEFCWLSLSHLENWYIIKLIVLPLFTFLVIKWINNEGLEIKWGKLRYFLFFFLFFVTILLCWIPNILRFELNPDESQWVAQANNFYHNPKLWIKYFWPREFSRILTIIPLSIASFINYPIKWIDARIFSVILWSLIVLVNFFTIKLLFKKNVATYASIIITWIISLMIQPDNVAYNSELPSVFLIVLVVHLLITFRFRNDLSKLHRKQIVFLLGLSIPCLPFVKEQNFYIAIFLELLFLLSLIKIREFKFLTIFLLLNMVVFVLIILPLFLESNLEYFINQVSIARNYYSKGLLSTQVTFLEKFKLFFDVLVSTEISKLFFISLIKKKRIVVY